MILYYIYIYVCETMEPNIKSINFFRFVTKHRDDQRREIFIPLLWIHKKFLIGTRVCEKLELKDYVHLQTLVQVALDYPLSLQQLREVHNEPYMATSLYNTTDQAEREGLIDMYFKVNKFAPIT